MVVGETGEYAGLNIFKGMSSIPSKFTTIGIFIQVCGFAYDSEYGLALTDISFKMVAYYFKDAQVLIHINENVGEHALKTFEYTADEISSVYKNNNYESLNGRVQVTTEITITDFFDADSGAIHLYTNLGVSVYISFGYNPYPNDKSVYW